MRKHPTDLHLEALLLDQSDEGREVLFHLCECERCRQRFRSRPLRQPVDEVDVDPEIPPPPKLSGPGLGFAVRLVQERIEAPELIVELLRRPVGARASLVRTDPRFRTWGVLELLIERSLATATHNSEEAEVLAALALLLADQLDAAFYGVERLEDLRARAWGHLANARRVRSDLHGAEEAFASARAHLRRGTHSPSDEAVLLDLEGSLRRDQRRFSEAFDLFRQAERCFRDAGDLHRAGRSLVNLSTVHYFAGGDIEEAIEILQRAVPLIDAEAEPQLRLCAGSRRRMSFRRGRQGCRRSQREKTARSFQAVSDTVSGRQRQCRRRSDTVSVRQGQCRRLSDTAPGTQGQCRKCSDTASGTQGQCRKLSDTAPACFVSFRAASDTVRRRF